MSNLKKKNNIIVCTDILWILSNFDWCIQCLLGNHHCSTSLRGSKALANELRLQTEIPVDTRHQLNPSDISPGTQPVPSYTLDIPQAVSHTTIKVNFNSANHFLKSVGIGVNTENISALEPVFCKYISQK